MNSFQVEISVATPRICEGWWVKIGHEIGPFWSVVDWVSVKDSEEVNSVFFFNNPISIKYLCMDPKKIDRSNNKSSFLN